MLHVLLLVGNRLDLLQTLAVGYWLDELRATYGMQGFARLHG